jgi:predicted metal-dependent HD superfamily phosphohydrolase
VTKQVPADLRNQFLRDGATEFMLAELVDHYSEPHRRYHGLDHVVGVVRRVNDLLDEQTPTLTPVTATNIRLAAWFHDAIYDATRHDNEDLSAELARNRCTASGRSARSVKSIVAMILMTKHHQPNGPAEAILADADLWTLGGSADEYFAYGKLIREEYAHVSDVDWRTGRGAFIARFSARHPLFHTVRGQEEREPQARANLAIELAMLTA